MVALRTKIRVIPRVPLEFRYSPTANVVSRPRWCTASKSQQMFGAAAGPSGMDSAVKVAPELFEREMYVLPV
jgi:hypothetical protein